MLCKYASFVAQCAYVNVRSTSKTVVEATMGGTAAVGRSRSARKPVTVAGEWSSKRRCTMPLAEPPIARSTRLLSRARIFACETALALARSPALLVRHLFSGERASLRPEVQIVAHGLNPRHAARHGKRFLNLYLRIHVS